MTMNELLNKIKISSKGSLHQTLKVQLKRGLIKKVRKQKEYKYSLTRKGKGTLDFLLEFSSS